MTQLLYMVVVNEHIAAKDMAVKDATLFARALLDEYWADNSITVTIKRMDCPDKEDERYETD